VKIKGFTHLHVHSHFTLLGATASVQELAERAATEEMTSLALTDSNVLYGAVSFDRACRAAGIQPITGMVVTVAPPEEHLGASSVPGILILLAMNQAGYVSLCRLSSYIQSSPERETLASRGLDWAELETHWEGLIALSGGRSGWIERLVRAGDLAAATRYAARLSSVYQGTSYLGLEIHEPQDRAVAGELIDLAGRQGIAPVATHPVYCLSPEDARRLRLLAAIDANVTLDSLPASDGSGVDSCWLGQEAIAERYQPFPAALDNVAELAARCGPALPGGRPIWPDLDLPDGQSPDQALAEQARAGMSVRYGEAPSSQIRERLDMELSAIAAHGYAPLFLVVAGVVRFARQAEIPVNTRGSVANSVVAYCAGITNVDPVAHDLLFERFLNPARADLPDIDLDFSSRRRDEVLDYVRRTYGPDHVALVSTVSTLQPRGAVRETAKAYGLSEQEASRLVAMLPRRWHPDPRRRDKRTVQDVIAELQVPLLQEIVQRAYDMVAQPHHLSVHPGGVVITPGSLTDLLPVQWAPKGFLITQFDHKDVEAIGIPKLDLLGIRALSVLADAERLVQRFHEPTFHLSDIPFDDPLTAGLLSRGETIGVFQCESTGAQRTLRKLQARSVRDLAVANAFFKPGPAMGGMAQTFVRRYRGEEPISYLHPALAPILEPTKGVLLFQEQVLRVAREIAGLSWAQADQLRRGMGHFGHQQMAELETQFMDGCQRRPPEGPGFSRQQADTLWEQVLAFSGYGFNQGHATSYAALSYRSAYVKAHWPAAFLCARLAERGGFHHPAIYQAEAVRLGLTVRPPHINHSTERFALEWEREKGILWMGLGQIRDLRRGSISAIVRERQRQPFTDLRDLLYRVPLQQKEIVHLIQCGALEDLGPSRAALLADASQVQQFGSALQMTFAFAQPQVAAESPAQRLAWEERLLGQPVSVHPLELASDGLPQDRVPLALLAEMNGRAVTVAGVRLPGWTGGQGFFLGDGQSFVVVRGEAASKAPLPWQPVLLRGRWLADEWGSTWLQAEELALVATPPG
jgi:DNA polymerase-3 subunit alpha